MEKFTYYFTPFVLFFVFRIVMCFIELKRNERFRVQQGKFYSVKHLYAEIGLFSGATIGGAFMLLIPTLWYVFAAIGIALTYLGFKFGRKKGIEFDAALRELALEVEKLKTDEITGEEHPAIAENAADTEDGKEAEEDTEAASAETIAEETGAAEEQEGENE